VIGSLIRWRHFSPCHRRKSPKFVTAPHMLFVQVSVDDELPDWEDLDHFPVQAILDAAPFVHRRRRAAFHVPGKVLLDAGRA
jgi:hypothetical protein